MAPAFKCSKYKNEITSYHSGFLTADDEGSESGHFVTNEDPSQKLKWQAHLEFTQNQELGELTWDKVRKSLNI